MKTDQRAQPNDRSDSVADPQSTKILAVALSERALSQMPRHVLAPGADVSLSTLARIDSQDVTGPDAPDLILAPLTTKGFDAMDLLATLTHVGFEGRVLLLTPHMPDIPMVRADVLAQAPALNVDVIALDGSSALHLL